MSAADALSAGHTVRLALPVPPTVAPVSAVNAPRVALGGGAVLIIAMQRIVSARADRSSGKPTTAFAAGEVLWLLGRSYKFLLIRTSARRGHRLYVGQS